MTPVSTTFAVRHLEWRSTLSAAEVHAWLIAAVPQLDETLTEKARAGDVAWVERQRRERPPLRLFEMRDQGSMLALEHRHADVFQYEIGNPLTAESMIRYRPGAGLYAPLRLVLYDISGEEGGGSVLAYDRPADLFGQFGDERVAAVGCDLDREIEAVARRVTAAGDGVGA